MCKTMFEADTVMQKLIDSVEGRKRNGGGFVPFTPKELELVEELAAWAEGTRFYVRFQNDAEMSSVFNQQLEKMTAADMMMFAMMMFQKNKKEGSGMARVALIVPALRDKLKGEG